MAAMSTADGGDSHSVARRRKPVVDGGANPPALDWRIARPSMAGNQQKHALTVNKRMFKRAINGLPCALQVMAVEVDDAVGLYFARAEAPVPA